MKKLVALFLVVAVSQSLFGQQMPLFSQYYWNDFMINPAFTGIKNTNRVQAGYRSQWTGFDGAPKTFHIGGHSSIKKYNFGLGGAIFADDRGGAIRQNGFQLNLAYNLKFNDFSGINFGVSALVNQYSYNGADMVNIEPDAVLQTNVQQLVPDMNFGLVYHWKNKLFVGLSSNQLIQSKLNKFNVLNLASETQLIRHYYLSGSYLAQLNDKWDAEPFVLTRTTFRGLPQFELGSKFTFNKLLTAGLSYRSNESVVLLAGINYKQFMLAYSYDVMVSKLRQYAGGSHEILLAYRFNKQTKSPKVIIEQPKDSDGDGVADNEDDCPEKSGSKENRGCPDSDGDGVIDKDDLCPNVKGLKEYKGCPDTDGDGVFDDLDECPKVVGLKENKGCPWPDSDNDGLSDNKDDCPTISGPVENRGCPYGDTDGDGVNDNVDPCPKTVGPVANKGCPVIEKKDQEVIDMAVKNLEFETSKDIIEESSKPSLNTLADKLKQKGEWNLLLSGHTDNVGDDDANMILSKNRAEAVKKYFISKGIAENRIKVNYFGETKPIADNSTPEGRQKNRRVEFVIVFE